MKLLKITPFLIILVVYTSPVFGQTGNASTIEDFVPKFNVTDSLARRVAFEEFDKRVAPNKRAAILSEMWEFVESSPKLADVRPTILAYLIGQKQMPWDDRLAKYIFAASKDTNPEMKRLVLNVLARSNTQTSRKQMLSFLKDGDDSIREAAIAEIVRGVDYQSVLKAYVKENEGKKERHNSVSKAKFLLSKKKRADAERMSAIRDFVPKFGTTDSLARRVAFEEFDKRVAPNKRAELLSAMWEFVKSNPKQADVRPTILAYLIGKGQRKQMPWDDSLGKHVFAASKGSNPEMRRLVLNVLARTKIPAARKQILSFLKDEDDSIREAAIIEIARKTDYQSVLSAYVKENEGKKERRDSVRKAKFFLSKQRESKQK